MDDAVRVQRLRRLAELRDYPEGVLPGQVSARGHQLLEVLAGHEVAHHDELVGHLVGYRHVGQARAVALRERGPHAATRKLGGNSLADEGRRAVQSHELGHAAGPACERPVDLVGVIDAKCMHDLLVVQVCAPSVLRRPINGTGYIQLMTDSSVRN